MFIATTTKKDASLLGGTRACSTPPPLHRITTEPSTPFTLRYNSQSNHFYNNIIFCHYILNPSSMISQYTDEHRDGYEYNKLDNYFGFKSPVHTYNHPSSNKVYNHKIKFTQSLNRVPQVCRNIIKIYYLYTRPNLKEIGPKSQMVK